MKKHKPLNLLDDKGFWPEKAAVADGIKELLGLGGQEASLPVRDYGLYRSPHWRDERNKLVAWQSADWYVYDALDEERMQVDAQRLLYSLGQEPWRDEKLLGDHYDLFVIQEDMFEAHGTEEQTGMPYVVGRCAPFQAAVISTHRIDNMWSMPYSLIKTEVMRQVCFLFGIPSAARPDVRVAGPGTAYCLNTCILREAAVAPDDWMALTRKRLRFGPLCSQCEAELSQFFKDCACERAESGKR